MALLGARAQERLELSLGQHHDLAELVAAHAEQTAEQVPDLVDAAADGAPLVVDPLAQPRLSRPLGDARPGTAGRPRPRRASADAEPPAADAHLELDERSVVGARVMALEVLRRPPVAGNGSVEREADGVEDARLARTGRPGQQEQAGLIEIGELEPLGAGERPERRHLETVNPHEAASSSTRQASHASRSRASSSAVGSDSRVSTKNCRTTSRSSTADRAAAGGDRLGAGADLGGVANHQDMRVALTKPLERMERTDRVGERGLHPRCLVACVARARQQLVERPLEDGQRPGDRRVDELGPALARCAELDQP